MNLAGSDSAPHPIEAKKGGRGPTAAGCFTQPWGTALVIGALEEAEEHGWIGSNAAGERSLMEAATGFLSTYGRSFYKLPSANSSGRRIVLRRKGERIAEAVSGPSGASSRIEVVPFRAGKEILSVDWT
jgi:dihydroorotase